jgi:hypothetical protein
MSTKTPDVSQRLQLQHLLQYRLLRGLACSEDVFTESLPGNERLFRFSSVMSQYKENIKDCFFFLYTMRQTQEIVKLWARKL